MQFSETQKTVFAMLTENTGTHFLDSGGTNGRMWQRNQGKSIQDFANEPEQSVNISNWVAANGNEYTEIERTVSVFHYLSQLELDDLCEPFNDIQDECNNWDADCEAYGVSREAWQMLIDECDPDIKIDRVWNTYNGESDLSQVLQGAWLEVFGEPYVLIQVHGGADVRGGYYNA